LRLSTSEAKYFEFLATAGNVIRAGTMASFTTVRFFLPLPLQDGIPVACFLDVIENFHVASLAGVRTDIFGRGGRGCRLGRLSQNHPGEQGRNK
jgi:hypothetical protein